MRKILLLTLFLFSITACESENMQDDNIKNHTEEVMLRREIPIYEETMDNEEEKLEENTIKEETKEEKQTSISTDKKEITGENKEEKNDLEEDIIDNTQDDYRIHKGRIDCLDIDECIKKSLPIQLEFKDLIDNIFYLEIKAKNGKNLGYFIEYSFKEKTYEDDLTCQKMRDKLKEKIPSYSTQFSCHKNVLITIKEKQNDAKSS